MTNGRVVSAKGLNLDIIQIIKVFESINNIDIQNVCVKNVKSTDLTFNFQV